MLQYLYFPDQFFLLYRNIFFFKTLQTANEYIKSIYTWFNMSK